MRRDGVGRLLVFRVGAELFAVEVRSVLEVVDAPEVRPVPEAPRVVLGVTMLHDQIVTVFDAQALLRVNGDGCGAALVFEGPERRIALAVSDVLDTLELEADQLRAIPGMDSGDGVLQGVVRRDTELIAVLDAGALMRSAATQAAEGGE